MKSLKIKLVLIFFTVAAVSLCTVSYINNHKVSNLLEAELANAATSNAEHNAMTVNQWLDGIANEANALAASNDVISMDPERYMPVLHRAIAKHRDYSLIYAADYTGNSMGTSGKSFNVQDRDYFQEALQGKTVISDPVMGKSTGKMVVVVAAPIYQDDQKTPAGILGISVTLEYLQKIIAGMKLGESGYGLIQHPDATTIAHPNQEFLGNKKVAETACEELKNILEQMAVGEKGYGYYTFEGIPKFMAFAPVESTGWSVAQTANVDEIMAPLFSIQSTSITTSLAAIIFILLITFVIATYIVKPLKTLSSAVDSVARGDLTGSFKISARKDEIGFLASSFEQMVANLKSIVGDIKNSSGRLASHSQELASASEEVSATIEEVASSTGVVAATSSQGAEHAEKAAQKSKQMQEVAESGGQAVEHAVQKINSIATSSQNIALAVNRLGDQSNQIGEIISTITNIADQTNLLALNAAIEAARAGEHGRGFAVVAEEVRKLAEQSAAAAGKITDLIKEIQSGVGEAVNALEHGIKEVNEGVEIANNAGESLQHIITAVTNNTSLIQEIATGAMQSNESTQELSASGEQISSTVQQVTEAAQDLARIADDLQKSVTKFKVDG